MGVQGRVAVDVNGEVNAGTGECGCGCEVRGEWGDRGVWVWM